MDNVIILPTLVTHCRRAPRSGQFTCGALPSEPVAARGRQTLIKSLAGNYLFTIRPYVSRVLVYKVLRVLPVR